METITISFGDSSYPFFLGTDCRDELVEQLLTAHADRYFLIADERIAFLYGEQLMSLLGQQTQVHLLTHREGEASKTLTTAEMLAERMLGLGATRASCAVALGGGVTGNLAGLVSALLFRGIRLIHVPTTLVAILDSVLSLKQAVNASTGKNLVGTFHRPEMVLADTSFLRTLAPCHVRSGLCEVIKNALAICPAHISKLLETLNPSASFDDSSYGEFVKTSIEAKVIVMANDPRESVSGLVLEYGHTVGHAVEHASCGALTHGECVGLGMLVAAEVGLQEFGLPREHASLHRTLLEQAGVPLTAPLTVSPEEIMRRVKSDNKRGYHPSVNGKIPMIILEALGRPCRTGQRPLVDVSISVLDQAMNVIMP